MAETAVAIYYFDELRLIHLILVNYGTIQRSKG